MFLISSDFINNKDNLIQLLLFKDIRTPLPVPQAASGVFMMGCTFYSKWRFTKKNV
jgi:hypothetical protein